MLQITNNTNYSNKVIDNDFDEIDDKTNEILNIYIIKYTYHIRRSSINYNLWQVILLILIIAEKCLKSWHCNNVILITD